MKIPGFLVGFVTCALVVAIYACANPEKATVDAQVAANRERDTANLVLSDPKTSVELKQMAQAAIDDAAKHDANIAAIKADIAKPATPDPGVQTVGGLVGTILPPPWGLVFGAVGGILAGFMGTRSKAKAEVAAAQAETDDANKHTDQLAKGLAEAAAAHPALATALSDPLVKATMGEHMDKDVRENIAGKMAVN